MFTEVSMSVVQAINTHFEDKSVKLVNNIKLIIDEDEVLCDTGEKSSKCYLILRR